METYNEAKTLILRTTINLIFEKGISALSIRHIADAANISKSNIYYYFDSKDDILNTFIEDKTVEYNELKKELENTVANRDRIYKIIEFLLEGQQHNNCGCELYVLLLMLQDRIVTGEATRNKINELLDDISEDLSTAFESECDQRNIDRYESVFDMVVGKIIMANVNGYYVRLNKLFDDVLQLI